MIVTSLLKLPLKIKVVLAALILSILLFILNGQMFTAATFAESCMFASAVLYLFGRYHISAVIARYQKGDYHPAKLKKKTQDLFVNTFAKVVLPVCLNMILACAYLLFIKYFHLAGLRNTGGLFNSVIDFNEHHLKSPLLVAGIIVSVLTLARVLTEEFRKKYKTVVTKITSPLKVMAILVLFISADGGIGDDNIQFNISREPVKASQLGSTLDQDKQDKAISAARKFVAAVVDESQKQQQQARPQQQQDSAQNAFFYVDVQDLRNLLQQHPELRQKYDFNDGSGYTADQQSDINSTFARPEARPEQPKQAAESRSSQAKDEAKARPAAYTEPFQKTNLSNKVGEHPTSFFDNIIINLSNGQEAIEETKETAATSIFKEYFGDILGDCIKGKVSAAVLPSFTNYSLFKDAAVDAVKEQLQSAFLYVVSKGNITKEELQAVVRSVATHIKTNFDRAYAYVAGKIDLLQRYMADVQERVVDMANDKFDRANPTTDKTYEDGLKFKQEMDKDEMDGDLLARTRSEYADYIRKNRTDLDADGQQELLDQAIADYKQEKTDDIRRIQEVVDGKKYTDFDYLKDSFTSGGIMFGHGLDSTGTIGDVGGDLYYPAASAFSSGINPPRAIRVVKANGKFFVYAMTEKGVLRLVQPADSAMLATAYRFVFSKNTYPSIIDMFYDYRTSEKHPKEIPAFHKSFVHNAAMKKLFSTADQFIFNMLDKRINSSLIERELNDARISYSVAQNSQDEPSYSRLFDESHYISLEPNHTFALHTNIKFSVVHTLTQKQRMGSSGVYEELTAISNPINDHKQDLIAAYDYLQRVHEFAAYQALFRSVNKSDINVVQLFVRAGSLSGDPAPDARGR